MEQKKFLFVSFDALSVDLAWQVVRGGHLAKIFIESAEMKNVGDGLVEKTNDWRKEIAWADVIIFDDVLGLGQEAEKLRQDGKLVIGGTAYTDRLEDNRAFGQEELKKFGIAIIPYQNFTSFEEAIEFVRSHPGRYVIKPSGEAQNTKSFLFVGEEEDGRDVIQMLEAYKIGWADKIKEFQLQKRVVGVEVAVGAFFNGRQFVYPININFEHKKLFPGNLGPSTGEMGTSMFWSEPNKLFNCTLKKIEEKLKEEHFVGYFDLNCIVNGHGIYPLEFTPRFGYPTIGIQQEGILTPIAEFLYGLADGTLERFRYKSGFQVGAYVVLPPFPFDDPKTFEVNSKDAVVLFKKPSLEGVHIEEIKQVNNEWVVTGDSGVVLLITGSGATMKQARSQLYNRISNIILPNMYYRKDIGDRWFEDSDKLHNWGYLRGV